MRTVIVATNPRGCRARSCTLAVATGRYVKSAPHCGYDTSRSVVTAQRHTDKRKRGLLTHRSLAGSVRCPLQQCMPSPLCGTRSLTVSRSVAAQDTIRQHLIQRGGGAKVRERGQQIWRVNAADHVRQWGAAMPVKTVLDVERQITAQTNRIRTTAAVQVGAWAHALCLCMLAQRQKAAARNPLRAGCTHRC